LSEHSVETTPDFGGADPESTVLDLTPRTKEMSMALAFDVAKPGNRLIYLRHGRQGAKVMPFSEELRVWPARPVPRRFGQKDSEGWS